MPQPFAGLGLQIDKPGRCELLHPVTRLPLAIREGAPDAEGEPVVGRAYIDVLSWHSKPAQAHRFLVQDRLRRERRDLTPEEEFDDMGEMLARMTVGWRLCDLHGNPIDVPCTFDMARELYNGLETRWLRNQVLEFVNNEGNFQLAS